MKAPKYRPEVLAWIGLAVGVAAWLTFPIFPVGLEIVAIALGATALKRLDKDQSGATKAAWIGIALAISKLLACVGTFLWVILAFMSNPVAH